MSALSMDDSEDSAAPGIEMVRVLLYGVVSLYVFSRVLVILQTASGTRKRRSHRSKYETGVISVLLRFISVSYLILACSDFRTSSLQSTRQHCQTKE